MNGANLHRLADAGVADKNDAIVLSDNVKYGFIDRANEEHIGKESDVREDALSVSGAIRVQHGILADAYSLHGTQSLADVGQL